MDRRCFEDAKTVEEIVDALSKEDGDDKFVASTLKVRKWDLCHAECVNYIA